MGVTRTNAPYVLTRDVWVKKNNSSSLAATITAPDVDGYTFVCWVGVGTDGDVGTPYIDVATSRKAHVWDLARKGANVVATALYQRS